MGAALASPRRARLARRRAAPPAVEVHRWIRPSVLTAGDVGRVEVLVQQIGAARSPGFELVEPVGADRTARMAVAPLAPDAEVSAGYRDPDRAPRRARRRAAAAVRHDVLGLARSVTERRRRRRGAGLAAGPPARDALARPRRARTPPDGAGPAPRARRLPQPARLRRRRRAAHDPLAGIGTIRAAEGPPAQRRGAAPLPRRCSTSTCRRGADGDEAFERAVTAAASLVHSADRAGLTTRFVDHRRRRPAWSRRRRADAAPARPHRHQHRPAVPVERDPGEGLGLVVVDHGPRRVGALGVAGACRRSDADDHRCVHDGSAAAQWPAHRRRPFRGRFLDSWELLAGVGRLDATRRDPLRRDQRSLAGALRDVDVRRAAPTLRRGARRRDARTPARGRATPASPRRRSTLAATLALAALLLRRRPRLRPRRSATASSSATC